MLNKDTPWEPVRYQCRIEMYDIFSVRPLIIHTYIYFFYIFIFRRKPSVYGSRYSQQKLYSTHTCIEHNFPDCWFGFDFLSRRMHLHQKPNTSATRKTSRLFISSATKAGIQCPRVKNQIVIHVSHHSSSLFFFATVSDENCLLCKSNNKIRIVKQNSITFATMVFPLSRTYTAIMQAPTVLI